MYKKTVRAIESHAIEGYPAEVCGLVVMVGRAEHYLRCDNKAPKDQRGDFFVISDKDMQAAEELGRIIAIVHSHPDSPATPSQADKVGCEETDTPWLIVSVRKGDDGAVKTDGIVRIQPEGFQAPLIHRDFYHGVLDCYEIVRDWYKLQRGIELSNFERADNWWKGDQELYLENFPKAGFVEIPQGSDMQPGDVILMQHHSDRVNHAAIYLDNEYPPGYEGAKMTGLMLHHLYGKPSEVAIYGGYWRDITRKILRHESNIKEV